MHGFITAWQANKQLEVYKTASKMLQEKKKITQLKKMPNSISREDAELLNQRQSFPSLRELSPQCSMTPE